MIRHCLAYAVALAASSLAALSFAGAEPRGVIELFTSQGCSSCPAADKLLGEFAADPTVVPISVPIDLWDYLGWKDTLADPRNTARQKGYAHVRGDGQIYTPQVVVNGILHVLGSDKAAIESAIKQSRQNSQALALPAKLAFADGRVSVSAPDGTPPPRGSAEVWLWGLARTVTVAIGRGENKGRTVTYHNVVRRCVKLGDWNGKANAWSVSMRALDGEASTAPPGRVQAARARSPPPSCAPTSRQSARPRQTTDGHGADTRSVRAVIRLPSSD